MDINDLRNPIEVWEAAIGRRQRLIELLESDEPLSRPTRRALALLIKGELQERGTARGKPPRKHDLLAFINASSLDAAATRYRRIAERLGASRMYGKAKKLIAHIASKTGVAEDALRAAIAHRTARPTFEPTVGDVNLFRKWARTLRAREKTLRKKRKKS